MNRVVAIVLGGGRGTRLYPLTSERAKPAVPLCGRYRLIDIPLSNCLHSGINQIFVLTQFNSVSLNRHITNSYKFDYFSGGFVEVLAAEQTIESGDWYQGTADAVRQHLREFRNIKADHYVILSGDQLYRMDYRSLLDTHLRTGADITVSALPVDAQSARGFGVLQVDDAGRIVHFVEKPSTEEALAPLVTSDQVFRDFGLEAEGKPYLASMGIYVFRQEVLADILWKRRDWVDFGKHVIPNSLEPRRVVAHLFDGFWEDIGTVRSYYEVCMQIVTPQSPFRFYDPHHVIYTHPRYLPGARLYDADVKNAIICEGSRIKDATVRNAIIGIRSLIQPGTTIERSIIMGADYFEEEPGKPAVPIGIGPGSHISGAIIDKNARVGEGVVIKGSPELENCDGDGYAIRDGVVAVLKNALIPPGTRIGAVN